MGHQVHCLLFSAHVALLAQFLAVSRGADYSAPEPAHFGAPAGGKELEDRQVSLSLSYIQNSSVKRTWEEGGEKNACIIQTVQSQELKCLHAG